MTDETEEPSAVDARIILYSRDGKTPKEIAALVKLSERQVYRIRNRWRTRWDTTAQAPKPLTQNMPSQQGTLTNLTNSNSNSQLDSDPFNVDPAREFCQLYLTSTDERTRLKCLEQLASLQAKNLYVSSKPLETTPTWTRPDFLTPKQLEVIEIGFEGSMLLYGDRQTGKSTAWFVAAVEMMVSQKTNWLFMGATGISGRKIISKLIRENPSMKPVLTDVTQTGFKTYNGAVFEIKDATIASVKGQTANVILDEFDQMLEHEDVRECLARLLPVFRSIPNAHLWLIANRGGQIFESVMDVFARHCVPVVILTAQDAPHIAAAGNDDFLHDMISTIAGDGVANQQLLNEPLDLEETFPNCGTCFGNALYNIEATDIARVVGVDPGFKHPTAIFVAAMDKWHVIHEICTIELSGDVSSEEYILNKVESLATEYAAEIVCESNSGALHWAKYWRSKGLRVSMQNFGGPNVFNSRAGFCSVARKFIKLSRLKLSSVKLRNQMVMYDPERNREAAKGDSVDAMLHCIWRLNSYDSDVGNGGRQVQSDNRYSLSGDIGGSDEFCFGT